MWEQKRRGGVSVIVCGGHALDEGAVTDLGYLEEGIIILYIKVFKMF